MKSVVRYIDWLEQGLLSLSFLLLLGLAFAQIILRNFFDSGLVWADEAIKTLVLWLAMLGALYATKQAKHINIDIAGRFLPASISVWMRRGLFTLAALICGTASYFTHLFVLLEKEDGYTTFLDIPLWITELIIPLGLFLMALRFLMLAYQPPAYK